MVIIGVSAAELSEQGSQVNLAGACRAIGGNRIFLGCPSTVGSKGQVWRDKRGIHASFGRGNEKLTEPMTL